MKRRCRPGTKRRDDGGGWRHAPAFEFCRRQGACPGIEELDRVGACLDLPVEIGDRRVDEDIDEPLEEIRLGQREPAHCPEIMATAALDHVGGHSPRAAGEADQGLVRIKGATYARYRLIDRGKPAGDRWSGLLQSVDRSGVTYRRQDRPLSFLEGKVDIEGMRDQQDVGEQDRGVHAEAAQRLQRHLGCMRRVQAEADEIRALLAERAVFREVATGLAHEPEGGACRALAPQGAHKKGGICFGHARLGGKVACLTTQ